MLKTEALKQASTVAAAAAAVAAHGTDTGATEPGAKVPAGTGRPAPLVKSEKQGKAATSAPETTSGASSLISGIFCVATNIHDMPAWEQAVRMCIVHCALCMCLCVCACATSCSLLCLPHPAPPPSPIVCAPHLASNPVMQRLVSPSRGCSPRARSPRGVGGPRQPPSPPSPSQTWSSRRPGCTSPPGRTRSWRRCVLRVFVLGLVLALCARPGACPLC